MSILTLIAVRTFPEPSKSDGRVVDRRGSFGTTHFVVSMACMKCLQTIYTVTKIRRNE